MYKRFNVTFVDSYKTPRGISSVDSWGRSSIRLQRTNSTFARLLWLAFIRLKTVALNTMYRKIWMKLRNEQREYRQFMSIMIFTILLLRGEATSISFRLFICGCACAFFICVDFLVCHSLFGSIQFLMMYKRIELKRNIHEKIECMLLQCKASVKDEREQNTWCWCLFPFALFSLSLFSSSYL